MSGQRNKETSALGVSADRYSTVSSSIAPTTSDKYTRSSDEHHDEKLDDIAELLPPSKNADTAVVDKTILEPEPVGVLQLFRFATPLDRVLTLAGVFFSCASGVVTPVMIIIFSKLMGVIIQYADLSAADLESANHYLGHESRHYCLL
ncbi:hypothetical protein H4R99_004985, partial [Coemansia sp. RSA 1722]